MQKNEKCSLTYVGKADARLVSESIPDMRLNLRKTIGKTDSCAVNMLIHGDNLKALKALLVEKAEGRIINSDKTRGVRLIYIDPPFSTRLSFKMKQKKGAHAYHDKLVGAEYIEALRARLILLRELLSDDGSIYLHLDWKMSHYMKVIMDEVFGQENFLNEIIWHYGGRGAKAGSSQFSRNHDCILFYKKKTHIFNKQWLDIRIKKGTAGILCDDKGRWFKTAPRGDYTDASITTLAAQGRIYKTKGSKLRIKYFLSEAEGWLMDKRPVGDVWDDIPDAMHLTMAEKTGYPTQKPLALLERIINTSSNQGDMILDAYCGCGTTLIAATKLGRRWIGIDSGSLAIKTTEKHIKRHLKSESEPMSFALYGIQKYSIANLTR